MSVTIIDTEDTNMSMIRNTLIKNLKTTFKLKDPHMHMYIHTYTQTTILYLFQILHIGVRI